MAHTDDSVQVCDMSARPTLLYDSSNDGVGAVSSGSEFVVLGLPVFF